MASGGRSGKGEHAGFNLNFQAPYVNIRDEQGRFTSAQQILYRQNQSMAFALQTQVARVIDNSILRKQVKSGRLVRATLDPKNAIYNREYVGVGNADFLDRSIAKYWRTIEEGSAATWTKRSFLSLDLQGLWGLNTQGWHMSAAGNEWAGLGGKSRSGGKPASPGGRRGAFGSARQEMYHPFRRGPGANLPVFHPKREIQPMNAYQQVKRQPQWNGMAVEHGRQFIERVMARGIQPSGFRNGAYG